jgi:ParB family chromosome partitioning protein
MELVDLPVEEIQMAPWNANHMDRISLDRLSLSIDQFGLIQNLVVRRAPSGKYEVLSGNQRLTLLREKGVKTVPCVVVDMDDAHAMLAAQALNSIHGDDDLGLKSEVFRKILESISHKEVLSILPESARSLEALASLNQESTAEHLRAWQDSQKARLKHLSLQFTGSQLEIVLKALDGMLSDARKLKSDNPNHRSMAFYLICQDFLKRKGEDKL